MKRTPARLALPLLAALLASTLGGCNLPYEIAKKFVKPKVAPTPTPMPATEIQAELVSISEDRAGGEGRVSSASVTVALKGTKVGEVASYRVVPTKIVDDLGTSLVPENAASEAQFQSLYFDPEYGQGDLPVSVEVPMKPASRKAKAIAEATAEVDVYTPALDPAALVTVPKFQAEAGKPVVSPVLQAAGVEVAILTPEQVEAEKKAAADRKRAELKSTGVAQEIIDMQAEWAAEAALGGFYGAFTALKVNDPNGKIQDFVFIDAAGKTQAVNRGGKDAFVILGAQGEEPGPEWGLQVRLKTPKTFQRYRFTLKDIALP
jgi:hypothetical protein